MEDRRVVILGKTGAGKSSLANTILGEKPFKVDDTSNSGTRECRAETRSVNGRNITLIDTPGFFDTEKSEEELKREIVRCIIECAPGPHAFLIVLKVEKFTEHEKAVINKIHQYFSEEVFKYATVVFTHGDQLKGQTIEEFVHRNKSMSDLVKKCGGRCHVIDNEYWNDNPKDEYRSNKYQVEKLLNTIDKITKANKGKCYTNEMLQVVEKEIQEEEKLIRESSGNMSEEEITRQAKDSAFNKIWIRLAGVATGALLGALFGVVLLAGVVVYTLKELVPAAKAVALAAAGAAGAGGTAAGAAGAGGTVAGAAGAGGTAAAAGAVAAGETAAGAAAAGAVAAGGTAAAEAAAAAAAAAAGGTAAAEAATAAAAGAAGVAGTAAGGGGAAGATAGGAAVAGGLGATGIALISIAAVSAAVGAAVGGYKGYNAAEEADTPWEAAKMTAAALKKGVQSIKSTIDGVSDCLNVLSKPTYSKLKES